MRTEIERKFLVADDAWRARATSSLRLRQGYLCHDAARTVRVRMAGDTGWLTIKGGGPVAHRSEFEYEIPATDAAALLDGLCHPPLIDKTRHLVPHGDLTFEVDVFHGENEGLVLAEVELSDANAPIELPSWIGREVTGDPRYYNVHLARHPFRAWPESA